MLKIAIDAGHGLYTYGKRCMKALDGNETREWYLNDRIADKLERILSNYDCNVLRVDDTTGKKDISLSNRCWAANNFKADVYISIHHNAGVNGGSGGGTIVYYYSSNVARNNQAIELYNKIVNQTGLIGNRSSRVIKNGFYVLKNTNMAAFLIENGFMDSRTDVPVILSEAHADKTVQGILNWLIDEFGLVKKSVDLDFNYTPGLSVGDTVQVIKNVTYEGKVFKLWHKKYTVLSLKSDRAVIGVNGVITAAVNVNNLKKV